MRLQKVWISKYKNLTDFNLDFSGTSFIEVFVGKNGTGKSNLFEAYIEIFRHLYGFDNRRGRLNIGFQYSIKYEIDNVTTEIEWKDNVLKVNSVPKYRVSDTPLPDNILIYYSGHNSRVDESSLSFQSLLKKHFRGGKTVDFHRFIFFDRAYKKLLITLFLTQPFDDKLGKTVKEKLAISSIDEEFIITLKRPFIVRRNFKIDRADDATLYWGIKGQSRDFLRRMSTCDAPIQLERGLRKSGLITDEGRPYYRYYIDIEKFKNEFKYESVDKLIEMFNSIKVIDIIDDIKFNVTLTSGQNQDINYFSDGQFQSIYLFSLLESFQDRNCLTLMDEPDSFLHPEWQYQFINQTKFISEPAKRKNQVLLTSHSPSTVAAIDNDNIVNFAVENHKVKAGPERKDVIISTLSAGFMSYAENEIILTINKFLKNNKNPVIFTEGISDEYILEVAWQKLYGAATKPFCIHGTFGRRFLYDLFNGDELKTKGKSRSFFALFDFDEAYDDWNGLWLKKAQFDNTPQTVFEGLTKKRKDNNHYASLLPVPNIDCLRNHALDRDNKPWGKGSECHISMEHLFYQDRLLTTWFTKKDKSGGGEIIVFTGDKVKFAEEIIPTFDKTAFEIFRPLFEFAISKSN